MMSVGEGEARECTANIRNRSDRKNKLSHAGDIWTLGQAKNGKILFLYYIWLRAEALLYLKLQGLKQPYYVNRSRNEQ